VAVRIFSKNAFLARANSLHPERAHGSHSASSEIESSTRPNTSRASLSIRPSSRVRDRAATCSGVGSTGRFAVADGGSGSPTLNNILVASPRRKSSRAMRAPIRSALPACRSEQATRASANKQGAHRKAHATRGARQWAPLLGACPKGQRDRLGEYSTFHTSLPTNPHGLLVDGTCPARQLSRKFDGRDK